ncbi:hypothetical protein QC764_0087450 [Podospora pseudoanserina]|uniref:Uncharacterized protein n=1 Tax=Podospora pseudoanserina TaxID=2609844 RepID=A0ABR0I8Z1_9PEZI|nr:hypothetical protein QC764_0087450 [Podospora pseudoanserina]
MGNQVLSIGGVTDKIKSVDAAPQGLLVFDMTAQTWNDNYDGKAKNYVRAKTLDEWYQNGGMDKVFWSSEQARALFATDTDAEPPGSAPSKLTDIPNGTEQADSRQDFSTT